MTTLAQLERGVVGYWCPMLATTGLRLYDRSVRKNHGTLTNMDAATDWVTASVRGRNGRVLDFDGTDDRVPVASASSLNPNDAISLAAWFRVTSTVAGVQQAIMRKGWSANSNLQYSISVFGDKIRGAVVNSSGTLAIINGGISITNNQWAFGVCTYDRTNVRVFLNGKIDGTTALTGAIFNASQPLQIGAAFDTNSNQPTLFLGGQIAEACIWNRAITASEIRTLYRLKPGWFGRREPRRRYAITQAAGVASPVLFHQHYVNQGWR